MDSRKPDREDNFFAGLTEQLSQLTDLDPADLVEPAGKLAEQLAVALDSLEEERPD